MNIINHFPLRGNAVTRSAVRRMLPVGFLKYPLPDGRGFLLRLFAETFFKNHV